MSVIIAEAGITVPGTVVDLESFSEWVDSPEFPERGRISYIHGNVVVDTSMEQPYTHSVVKLWIAMALATIARDENLGTVFADRMRLRNDEADVSNEPDAMFVSFASSQSGRVRLVEGTVSQFREFEGSPEMVLEVISDSSEEKDCVDLKESYYRAGIDEYWLVDAREEQPVLNILRQGPRGYVNTRHLAGGWVRSQVFDRAFRLVRKLGPDGNPQFTLESRD